MGGYHALMHLVKDQLIDYCEPRTVSGAIAGTGVATFVPNVAVAAHRVPDGDHDHGEVPSSSVAHVVMGQQVTGNGDGK